MYFMISALVVNSIAPRGANATRQFRLVLDVKKLGTQNCTKPAPGSRDSLLDVSIYVDMCHGMYR